MQLCVVNGSLRGNRGVCGRILDAVHKGFVHAGGTVETLNLSEKRIESCRACNHCQISKTYKCIYNSTDDVAAMFQRIRDADIVLYATPIYVFGISSLLKKFIERFYSAAPVDDLLITESGIVFHATDKALMSKPLVSIIVSDNLEDITVKNARGYFKNFAKFFDAPHLAHIERRSASIWLSSLKQSQSQIGQQGNRILEAYETMGYELAKYQHVSSRTKYIAEMKLIRIPFIVKVIWRIPALRPKIKEEMSNTAHAYFIP
jgi:multimeric flavodoxin WrbA